MNTFTFGMLHIVLYLYLGTILNGGLVTDYFYTAVAMVYTIKLHSSRILLINTTTTNLYFFQCKGELPWKSGRPSDSSQTQIGFLDVICAPKSEKCHLSCSLSLPLSVPPHSSSALIAVM